MGGGGGGMGQTEGRGGRGWSKQGGNGWLKLKGWILRTPAHLCSFLPCSMQYNPTWQPYSKNGHKTCTSLHVELNFQLFLIAYWLYSGNGFQKGDAEWIHFCYCHKDLWLLWTRQQLITSYVLLLLFPCIVTYLASQYWTQILLRIEHWCGKSMAESPNFNHACQFHY